MLALGLDRRLHITIQSPEATLAAGQVPCHLQNCYYHASDFPPSMPVVPLWPCCVCFGRLECTPSSLLHVLSRCRPTKQDAVRKARLLSGRLRHYGTVSPLGRHHPYHRLPSSLPSCPQESRHICSAQHLTISFYFDIDIVMHNQSIFNLCDWAL